MPPRRRALAGEAKEITHGCQLQISIALRGDRQSGTVPHSSHPLALTLYRSLSFFVPRGVSDRAGRKPRTSLFRPFRGVCAGWACWSSAHVGVCLHPWLLRLEPSAAPHRGMERREIWCCTRAAGGVCRHLLRQTMLTQPACPL